MNYTVYSKPACAFCDQAKALLKSKGLAYDEVIIDVGQPKIEGQKYITASELKTLIPSARTAPQIMLGEQVIGGFTELKASLA